MSVIVYHRGVMVADSRAYSGCPHPVGTKRKIHRLSDGSLLGVVSNVVGMPESLREWIEAGASKDDFALNEPSFEAIHVKLDGRVFLYNDGYSPSGPLEGETFTIGSGKKYALGAIRAGKSAEEAVAIAIECDLFCGYPISSLPLREEWTDV